MNLDRNLLRQALASRWPFSLAVGLGFLGGLLTIFQAWLLSRVIGQVFLPDQPGWAVLPFVPHSLLAPVSAQLLLLLVVFGLRAILTWGSESAAHAVARRVKTALRMQLCEHLLALGPAYTQGERAGELVNLAGEGIETLDAYFSQYLPQLLLAVLLPLTILAFVLPLDPLSGLVLLLTAPLLPLFMVLIGSAAQALTQRQWVTLSRMSAYFLDLLQGLPTLKMLGRSRAQVAVVAQVGERFRQVTMRVLRVTFLSALALEMVATLSTAIVAVQIGLRLLYGYLSFEPAFFVLLLAPEFYQPLRSLGARFHAGMAGAAAARRIFEILALPVDGGQGASSRSAAAPDAAPPALRFEAVAAVYPDGRPALEDISFELRAGEALALAGPSGAGKSSLASLLLRFLQPAQGRIWVGDTPLEALDMHDWRAQVAWAPQNPYLFYASAADNIRLARPQASMAQVIEAARLAQADVFIQALPQGYDTLLGERGARLSAGQAQRIALARAFLKDAPLLILDEPTASLDAQSEAQVQLAVKRLLQGRTALVIAHRLNTLADMDRLLILQSGKLVQQGAPAQILQQEGLFQQMIQASASPLPRESSAAGMRHSAPFVGGAAPAPVFPTSAVDWQAAASERNISGHLPTLGRLLSLARPFAGLVLLSVLAAAATVGSGIGLMTASAYIISAAALHPSIAELQVAIVGVRFFGLARGVFRYLERYLTHQVTFHLLAALRAWFYQALEPLAPARLLYARSGDLLGRILGDIHSLEQFYVRALAPPLAAGLLAPLVSLWLGSYLPASGYVLLAGLMAAGLALPFLVRLLSKKPGRLMIVQRADLNAALLDTIQGLPDLLAFGAQDSQVAALRQLDRQLTASQRRLAQIGALQTAALGLLAHLSLWAVLVLSIPLVSSGKLPGVLLASLVLAALTSFEAVQPLPAAAQHLESSLQAAARLFHLVSGRPEVPDPPDPLPLPSPGSTAQPGALQVAGLCFHYPAVSISSGAASEPWVLENIDFELPPGGRLAIVGPSGAGKSTLISLLLRFWDYRHGRITWGGADLRQYCQEDIRRQMAVVAQNAYLFSASLRQNLLLARPDASQSDLDRAMQAARLHEFLHALPEGYETWIGDQGLRLSAGERQRLAIARALLKDAPLLLLDEPTANLDPLTERQVIDTLHTLMAGRATLWITHRLVEMQRMDEILVLDGGRIVERGRHQDLLAAHGLYRRLWELQNVSLVK